MELSNAQIVFFFLIFNLSSFKHVTSSSNSPFHAPCFQKVVMEPPPRKLKIHLMVSLTAATPLAIAEQVAALVLLVIPGSQFEQRQGMGLPTTTLWLLCGPQHSHVPTPWGARGLCLLRVAGNDISDLETEIRHQCKGQL